MDLHTFRLLLLEWDGSQVDILKKIYEQVEDKERVISFLLELLCADSNLQVPVTWILKYHLESGQTIPSDHLGEMMECLNDDAHWEAKLHYLQSVPLLKFEQHQLGQLENFARREMASHNKFVRTWAYNALAQIAKYIPEVKGEIIETCEIAMMDESPAVRARLRNILKDLKKD